MIPKFRAWDKVINQMFIPDSIHFDSKGMVDGIGSKETIFGIEDFELMQSTGLADVNDKEIYEGDVVKFSIEHDGLSQPPRNIKYEIAIEDGVTLIKNAEHKLVLKMVNEDMEIIGNIHEHSDLLENI